MNDDIAATLVGRASEARDWLDPHRLDQYRRFFVQDECDSALAVHWMLFTDLPQETRNDGHPATMVPFPSLPYPRRMWAGGELIWHKPLAVGQPLTRASVIAVAEPKTGSAGNFLLAAVSHRITADGETLIEERQDVVFLPPAIKQIAAQPRDCGFDPAWETGRCYGPVDLFRYSALTLNSHRIHYDADYARSVEHYQGLVVHGPLLASELMHEGLRHHQGATPRRFSYRAVAPSFAQESLRIVGTAAGAKLEVAIMGPDDGVRMIGQLEFLP